MQDATFGLDTSHIGSPGSAGSTRPRRRLFNPQQMLPLVQALALPLHWLIGRQAIGLSATGATIFMLVVPFVLHTVVLGAGFVVSWRNQHEERGIQHSLRRDWLIAYAREALMSIKEFYWFLPFRAGFRMPAPVPPVQPLPIILIHGYGCNRGLWLPAARWFAGRGYRVSAISLAPLHCDIGDYVPAVTAEVARVRKATGAPRVALIGHSMGGLVARAYLQDCEARADDAAIAALVTIGTPHCGTHIASIGPGENARQMRYRSPWMAELGPRHRPGGAAALAICGLQDNIVSRPFEQRLPMPGARTIHVRRHGHMSLAASPRVLRIVDRVLRRATLCSDVRARACGGCSH